MEKIRKSKSISSNAQYQYSITFDFTLDLIDCDFEIVSHFAGVRPTVRDRRPLVGTHAEYNRIHILNGLGTRGVMLGPAMAKALYDAIENQIPLVKEIDIQRFANKKK